VGFQLRQGSSPSISRSLLLRSSRGLSAKAGELAGGHTGGG
jgi:hypothetical protein